jgi:hypothetical protein
MYRTEEILKMRLNADELVTLGRILKAAQDVEREEEPEPEEKPKKKRKRRKKRMLPAAFPDYAKSLVTQSRRDPTAAGLIRGAGSGALGAVLGALIARIASKDPKIVGGGAAAGGLLGAVPGYMSGRREALSDYSRLLFLRRLGVRRPGELEALVRYPETTEDIIEEGVQI